MLECKKEKIGALKHPKGRHKEFALACSVIDNECVDVKSVGLLEKLGLISERLRMQE